MRTKRNPGELTKREIDVVKLIWQELSTEEIGTELKISVRTVEAHKWNISHKLRAKSNIGIAKYALKAGLVTLE
jgi:DNA-binding NarL/FixJ family response regulator